MPHATAHVVMSCAHCAVHAHMQAGHPYVYMACQELLMDMPFAPAQLYIMKLTASHFTPLNIRIVNQNVIKMILIAMLNENMANCNENFWMCAEESLGPCTSSRLQKACRERDITITILVLVHFGLINYKPKKNTNVFLTHFTCCSYLFQFPCNSSYSQFGC